MTKSKGRSEAKDISGNNEFEQDQFLSFFSTGRSASAGLMLGPLENQDRLRDMKPCSSFDGGYPPTVLMLGKTHGKSPSVPPPLLGSPRTHHCRSVARNSPTMSPLIPVPTTQFPPIQL